jgi:hypothetical protein
MGLEMVFPYYSTGSECKCVLSFGSFLSLPIHLKATFKLKKEQKASPIISSCRTKIVQSVLIKSAPKRPRL